jgi:hypothetical protein
MDPQTSSSTTNQTTSRPAWKWSCLKQQLHQRRTHRSNWTKPIAPIPSSNMLSSNPLRLSREPCSWTRRVALARVAATFASSPAVRFVALLGRCAAYVQGGLTKLANVSVSSRWTVANPGAQALAVANGQFAVHGTSAHAWLTDAPSSDAQAFWGAFGCGCWMA